jgi:hypothetical protein
VQRTFLYKVFAALGPVKSRRIAGCAPGPATLPYGRWLPYYEGSRRGAGQVGHHEQDQVSAKDSASMARTKLESVDDGGTAAQP